MKKLQQINLVISIFVLSFCSFGCQAKDYVYDPVIVRDCDVVWLDELDVSKVASGYGSTQRNLSIDRNPMTIAGVVYDRGIGTHATGEFNICLDGESSRFKATVGIDDEVGEHKASVEFMVYGDGVELWRSGVMKPKMPAKQVDVDVSGVKHLKLVVDEGENNSYDHADWADASIEIAGKVPVAINTSRPRPYILTPKPGLQPRITGPKVFGVRPGNPFLFTVTATGQRPMKFLAINLPRGLSLDFATGRITGTIEKEGTYKVKLAAENSLSKNSRAFTIKAGDTIALTPPMGWNSWNCWGCAVDDEKVRATAKAIVDSGLINHGWSYVNIDDCWMVKLNSDDPIVGGKTRDENGMILTNEKFPDMQALTGYIHGLGLKVGLYTSPGPFTCQSYEGAYEHEALDAQKFAEWGFDYLKYDWCGYGTVSKGKTLEELKKPYQVMRRELDHVKRDIVYSLCQYGMGDIWEWGEEVGGNCWRTTGDITDSWSSMSKIGFSQDKCSPYAKPGYWNDPDMLVVGQVGWGPNLHPSNLTPDEQYTHISLWCLLDSPLLIGCPVEQMDEFTLNLLTNDEVLEVNQDSLGIQAVPVFKDATRQVWAKKMEDGSTAVGLFNLDGFVKQKVTVKFKNLGINGDYVVRDLWRQRDIGVFSESFTAVVPSHGVVLVKISEKK
ncbi:MAG: NPCBM/NEW2 domain-containing protein [Phycisphaerae bacterium]|nr:NPCBM/NEW2 domain-containing protein [Phycisphaerae bacterium]